MSKPKTNISVSVQEERTDVICRIFLVIAFIVLACVCVIINQKVTDQNRRINEINETQHQLQEQVAAGPHYSCTNTTKTAKVALSYVNRTKYTVNYTWMGEKVSHVFYTYLPTITERTYPNNASVVCEDGISYDKWQEMDDEDSMYIGYWNSGDQPDIHPSGNTVYSFHLNSQSNDTNASEVCLVQWIEQHCEVV